MKKLLALVLVLLANPAAAAETCYRLEPYFDKIEVTFLPASNGRQQFFGRWISPGTYSMPIMGARAGAKISVFAANPTKRYFNGNVSCALAGEIGGKFTVGCGGGKGAAYNITDADQPPEFPTKVVAVACGASLKTRKAQGWRIGAMGRLP